MQPGVTDSVLERLRKLQKLTRSTNQHEAALAAAKMQEILFAHNLSVEALTDPSEYVETRREIGSRVWAQRLFMTLCRNNFCEPLYAYAGVMCAVGKRENVEAVNDLFVYLAREIERIAKAACREYQLSTPWPEPARQWTSAFRNGAVAAISARLKDQRERDIQKLATSVSGPEGGTAIICRLELELKEEVGRRYPHLGTRRAGSSWIRSSAGYEAGQAAGSGMSLQRSRRQFALAGPAAAPR